jgi:hypothetical protein
MRNLMTSSFRYALQPALDEAHAREREARGTYAACERALALERDALAALERHAAETRTVLANGGIAPAGIYAEIGRRLEALTGAERSGRERIARASRALAQAREALALAAHKRTAVERHRARKLSAHEALEALREAEELDESNALRARAHGR